jgi:GTP-binding protein
LIADPQLSTLLDFKYRQHHRATSGEHGRGRDQYGARGVDLTVRVPLGTIVREDETGAILGDLKTPGQRLVAAAGGRGGRGNIHFATPQNQAPRTAEPGTAGEERWIRLELRLLADVGLVGYPNVGKSSFIARVSRARPKIADYAFTTLTPNLGVVRLSGERSLVLADIPGLIEGAGVGAGLGLRFLRHIERTRVLIHLIEVVAEPGRDPLGDYDRIQRELGHYDPALFRRPQLIVLNKLDLTETRARLPELTAAFAVRGLTLHAISAATGEGMAPLLEEVWRALSAAPPPEIHEAPSVRGAEPAPGLER